MSEPAGPVTLSLLAVAIGWLGPVAGPYALIAFAAVAGGLLALSVNPTGDRWAGIRYLAVAIVVALVITGPIVWALETYFAMPARIALIPVAFLLGAKRDWLLSVITKVLDTAATVASTRLNDVANRERGGGQ